MELLIFICVGVFTGLSAGLLGVGGGIISVPAMIFLLPYFDVPPHLIVHIAIATSLMLIIPTSILSAYSHSKNNAIEWSSVKRLVPGLILGGVLGAGIIVSAAHELLQAIFSGFLMLIALYMLFGKTPTRVLPEESRAINDFQHFFPSLFIGIISSMMGVGGGTMTVPYLVWRGLALPKAIGSSAFCGLPIAVAGSVSYFVFNIVSDLNKQAVDVTSYLYFPAFIGILIGVVISTPVGAKLAHTLNVVLLKRVFVAMLFLVSIKLMAF